MWSAGNRKRRSRANLLVDAVKDDLAAERLAQPVAVIALVMLCPFAITAAWTAANTSKVHPAGFIAVSRRFHALARVPGVRTRNRASPRA